MLSGVSNTALCRAPGLLELSVVNPAPCQADGGHRLPFQQLGQLSVVVPDRRLLLAGVVEVVLIAVLVIAGCGSAVSGAGQRGNCWGLVDLGGDQPEIVFVDEIGVVASAFLTAGDAAMIA